MVGLLVARGLWKSDLYNSARVSDSDRSDSSDSSDSSDHSDSSDSSYIKVWVNTKILMSVEQVL